MATIYKGFTTGTLFLAAAVATGCTADRSTPPQKDALGSKQPVITKAADEEFTPAPALAPVKTGPVSFADGETAYQAGQYSEASRVFASFTEQRPDHVLGHFMLGLSSWKAGNLAGAEKAFDEALRLNPDHVKSLVNLSRVLIEQHRADDAIEKLARAGELDSTSGDVQRLLGRAYREQGKTDEAVLAYQRAIDINGEDGWAMNNLGLLFLEEGRAADALPLLTRAAGIGKDVAVFHNNLGMALEHTGRFADAAAAYTAALAAAPGNVKAQRNLARVEKVKEAPKASDEKAEATPVVEKVDEKPVGKADPARTPVDEGEDR